VILPKLRVVTDDGAYVEHSTCLGQDNCPSCPLYVKNDGRCDGCTPAHKATLMQNFKWCFKECHECAGYKVKVTAVCCRSPLRDMYMTAVTRGAENWNHPSYRYVERPLLDVKQRSVFYISSGGVNTITAGGHSLVEGTPEAVAVNLTRVWSGNGFFSHDLKDYLHLPAKTRLVLMTMTLDDLLERAWEKELYADPFGFQKVGLDAWMPLSFSAYPNEAHMHQYYQLLRTLYATEQSHASFVTGDHFMPGLRTDDLVLAALEHIPQMVFNTQFAINDDLFKYHLRVLRHYHQLVPANVRFWVVGSASPTFIHNVRRFVGTRVVYYLSSKALYLASKGQAMTTTGAVKASQLGKLDLLYENQRSQAALIAAYDRADR
jgi:hypothetical protein